MEAAGFPAVDARPVSPTVIVNPDGVTINLFIADTIRLYQG
jgi:hypothetical protein